MYLGLVSAPLPALVYPGLMSDQITQDLDIFHFL